MNERNVCVTFLWLHHFHIYLHKKVHSSADELIENSSLQKFKMQNSSVVHKGECAAVPMRCKNRRPIAKHVNARLARVSKKGDQLL